MNIDINDIIAGYNAEVGKLTQRAIVAEAERDALRKQLATSAAEKSEEDA